jgi:hypothetical protein
VATASGGSASDSAPLCQKQSARRRLSTYREAIQVTNGRRSAQEQRDQSGRVRTLFSELLNRQLRNHRKVP